jgi:hypothetical protein
MYVIYYIVKIRPILLVKKNNIMIIKQLKNKRRFIVNGLC